MRAFTMSLLFAALNTELAGAASGAGEDSSSIFSWIFFGMVGLIIAVLLVPAARSLRNLAGDVDNSAETAEEKVPRN